MQLYLGGVCGQVLTMSHFGHQSQIRAQASGRGSRRGLGGARELSNRIRYHVRKRLAAGKVTGRPVLAQALQLAKAGYALKLATQTPWQLEFTAHKQAP